MTLFEITDQHRLLPYQQLRGGAQLYESEIENLLWESLEEIVGDALFRVNRRPAIPGESMGIPDMVALTSEGSVVVIEIKRDVDRSQLAQCLEYAGWARTTNLDELASIYHSSDEDFFRDWQEFTETDTPRRIQGPPRLVLVARDLQSRTGSALEYLIENGLPVKFVRVALYRSPDGQRFLDVEGEHEPGAAAQVNSPTGESSQGGHAKIDGRRVRIDDLLEADELKPDEELVWRRRNLDVEYRCVVRSNGLLELPDGRTFGSPSPAASAAANSGPIDGWRSWHNQEGIPLSTLRARIVNAWERRDSDSILDDEDDDGHSSHLV